MSQITIDQLGDPSSISEPHVASAAAEFAQARAAVNERKRDVTELEQTRSNAEWADAEAEHQAAAAGKPVPAKQKQTLEHDAKTEKAKHAHKVAVLGEKDARDALLAAIGEYGDSYQAEANERAVEAAKAVKAWIETGRKLLGEQTRAVNEAKQLGSDLVPAEKGELNLRQMQGITPAEGSSHRAFVYAEDLLIALASIGNPGEYEEPRTGMPDGVAGNLERSARTLSGKSASGAAVDAERQEREAFAGVSTEAGGALIGAFSADELAAARAEMEQGE